jgi:hypothetical protein
MSENPLIIDRRPHASPPNDVLIFPGVFIFLAETL